MGLKNFRDWKLFTKIFSISILSILIFTGGLFFYLLPKVENRLLSEKHNKTQHLVELATTMITQYVDLADSGKLSIADAKERALQRVKSLRYAESNYIWINDLTPRMIMHPIKDKLNGQDLSEFKDPKGKFLFREMADVCKRNGSGFVEYMWPKPGFDEPVPKVSFVSLIKPWGWVVGTGIYVDDVQAEISSLRLQMAFMLALSCGLLITVTLFILRRIVNPIKRAIDLTEKMSEGDFTQTLDIKQRDEIGVLSEALNNMIKDIRTMIKDIAGGVGSLTSASTELSAISQQMATGSEQSSERSTMVARASEEMSTNMSTVVAATEQTSSNVQMVASAAEQMSSTIEEIASNTDKGNSISNEAVNNAARASQKVNELGDAADEIGKVTEAITEISEQTNLLALNATIEAARAGEAGKGFAVVANEIKDLAQQTAKATLEIKQRIGKIQATTTDTVSEIEQITKVISDINEIVTTVSTAVEEQSVTTKEIAGNVVQASRGIQEMTENVTQSFSAASGISKDITEVNQASQEMASSSSQVNQSAGELSRLAETLNEMVMRFKT